MTLISAVGVGIPVGMIIHWYTQSNRSSFYDEEETIHHLWPATLTSFEIGVAAAVVAVALALPVAILVVRHRDLRATVLERATYLAFALPDLVGAIAIAYAATHYAHLATSDFALLVLAEAILFVPFAVVALRATLGQIEPALEASARSLGAGALKTLWRVTLPLARPGLAAAAVLVFAFTLGDISTTNILLPAGLYTLGTEFEANGSTVAFAAAAPFAAVLMGLALMATYVLMSRFGRVRSETS
jgi:iron(III) transport system permease protein